MKMTKAYRAALAQLADAIAQQDPTEVVADLRAGHVTGDLFEVVRRRHPAFGKTLDRAFDELQQQRKRRASERRRAARDGRP